ncbi:MAG: hypothetical protein AcusKO_19170 [Acuticoccus sp.]
MGEFADKVGRRPAALRIKDTRAQWGSCTPGGVLSFSWRLVLAPRFVLRYVAAHEVAHLIELNHSSAFWALNAEPNSTRASTRRAPGSRNTAARCTPSAPTNPPAHDPSADGNVDINALVAIVLPVFGLIGLGYATVATGILNDKVGDALTSFVFVVAMPLLLFRGLGTLAVPPFDPWPYYLAYFGGAAINIALGVVVIRRAFGRDARVGVIAGLSASYSNIVMLGMPMAAQAYGEPGLTITLLLIAVHLPIMMLVSAIMIEIVEARNGSVHIGRALKRVAYNLVRNPIVIGILAGVAFRFTGLELSGVPATVIERISATAIPLALFSLGMSLRKYGIRNNVPQALAIGSIKLFVMPLVVYVLAAHVFQLPDLAVAAAVLCAACPTGANAYLIATRFQTGLSLSANSITLTTAVSVLTLWMWFAFLTL